MAQKNWWEDDEVVDAPPPTLPERKMGADIDQSGASTEKTREEAITERVTRPIIIRKMEADASKAEAETKQEDRKVAKMADADAAAVAALRNVIDKIDTVALDSADNNGWFETGWTGAKMRDWVGPGTAAFDLAQNVKTVDSNTAFAALQKMRENSPTGGAVGNVSDKDLELLKSTVANLDPDQSQDQFLSNAATVKRHYLDMLRRLDPAAAEEYRTRKGIRFKDDSNDPGTIYLAPTDDADEKDMQDPFGVLGTGDGGGGGAPPANAAEPPAGPDGGGGNSGPGGGWSLGGVARRLGEGTGSIVEGIGDIPGALGGNLIGNALYRMGGYNQNYDMGETLRGLIGLPDNPNSTTDTMIKLGSTGMLGGLGARGLASLTQPGVAKNVLSVFGANPIRDAVAGTAAGGASELAKSQGAGGVGQTLAALGGGALGYGGASAAARTLGTTGTRIPTELAQIAERQGVPLLPADVGGPLTRLSTSAAKASPFSTSPVIKAAENSQAALGEAATRAARSQGQPVTTDQAGQWLADAAKRYTAKSQDIGNTMYQRAYKETEGLQIPARGAIAKIDTEIKQLSEAPRMNAGAIDDLQKLRADLSKGMTVKGLHDLRSTISGGVFDGKLRSGAEQARMKGVRAALSDDIFGYLKGVGLTRAANQLKRADNFWEQRVEQIDQVLQPIIGKEGMKGGEEIIQSIESMAKGGKGGNQRLSRMLNNMTADERGQLRSTIIDRLGRATAGNQNAEGNVFSPSTFLTNWNKMTPQAKDTLFKDDGLRRNLDDIAKLASGMRVGEKLTNRSNTAGALQGSAALQAGWALNHIPSYLAGAGAQFLTGRLMASPAFAKKLATAPATKNPRTWIESLGVIGMREPALQADIAALQQDLLRSLVSPAPRAAADDKEQN